MSQQQAKPSTPTKSQPQQGEKYQKPRQSNGTNNTKQDEEKPYIRSGRGGSASRGGGSSRGGPRVGSANAPQKRNVQKQTSKTVFVGRIFFDDLYTQSISTSLADKLKDQRVRLLKEVFTQFGDIEAVEAHFNNDDNNFMLVTYENRESAVAALASLKSKDKVNEEMDNLRSRLDKQKQFPPNVCPELYKYRYDWSDKPAISAKSNKNNKNFPKTVIAGTNPLQAVQTQQVTTISSAPQTNATNATNATNGKNKKAKKDKKTDEVPVVVEKVVPAKKEKPIKRHQGSGDLQREAEKAKLKEEAKYLQNQQTHVSNEIQAEKTRAKERDARIIRLSTELQRIREEEQALQNKLNAETNYRSDAEHRIQKLREELSHMHQEEQIVNQKMSVFEQQELTAQQNGTF
jgi:hypothetical protein